MTENRMIDPEKPANGQTSAAVPDAGGVSPPKPGTGMVPPADHAADPEAIPERLALLARQLGRVLAGRS